MRILIADNQPKVRFALRVALERQPGSKTVGEATDTIDLLAEAKSVCPDMVLLDWNLPGMSTVELLRELHRLCACVVVIVLSEKSEIWQAAIAAGADAFVSKGDPPEYLLKAIRHCWSLVQSRAKVDCESLT